MALLAAPSEWGALGVSKGGEGPKMHRIAGASTRGCIAEGLDKAVFWQMVMPRIDDSEKDQAADTAKV